MDEEKDCKNCQKAIDYFDCGHHEVMALAYTLGQGCPMFEPKEENDGN